MDTEIEATPDADSREIKKEGCVLFSQNGKTDMFKGTPGAAEQIHFKSSSSDSESMESRETMHIEETSGAAEQTEIEVTSDPDSVQIEKTSAAAEQTEIEEITAAAEQTEIKVTSEADAVLTEGTSAAKHFVAFAIYHYIFKRIPFLQSPKIKGTSAAIEHTHIEATSAAGSLQIEGKSSPAVQIHSRSSSSAAAEQTEIEVTSDADSVPSEGTLAAAEFEQTEIEETLVATEQTEIKVTSDTDALLTEGTSAAKQTVASAIYHYILRRIPFLHSPKIKGTSAAIEDTHIEATSGAGSLQIEGKSSPAEHIHSRSSSSEAESMESGERLQIEGTSAAADSVQIEGTSAAADSVQIKGTSAAADSVQIKGTSAAAEHTERVKRTQWPTNSIFRAPAHIKNYHEPVFEPKLVSIGPYFHGDPRFQHMEHLKLRCIPEIQMKKKIDERKRNLPRPSKPWIPRYHQSIYNVPDEPSRQGEINIDDIPLELFMSSGKKARAYYKEECKHSLIDFVRILFIDSCFIIRTILSLSQQVHESMAFLDVNIKDIRSDLLILENQIPLFFIREVYEWLSPVTSNQRFPHFNTVLEPLICLDMPWTINHDGMMSSKKAAHLLDLYWRCSLSPPMYKKLSELERHLSKMEKHSSEQEQPSWAEIHLSNNTPKIIANATELNKMAGIEFKKFKDKGHFEVIFSKGIIQMPRLKIDTRQKNLLINLIAFENCILPCMRNFSCYMKLMDALIDSENDVKLLQQCGVIYNTLNNHEMAATFFNDIGNFCFIDYNTNHYSGLYKAVEKYYDSSWHRRWTNLQQSYFSSPWAGISLFAAGFLLILSVVQTFYAVYGYYKPMK